MEGLQFAQILADLTQLQQSDNTAALNLLRCNTIITEEEVVKNAKKTAVMAGKRPKFDTLGRKRTDPLTSSESEGGVEIGSRKNSRLKLSAESQGTIDQDLKRAKDLMALYRLRGQIEHKDTMAMAREKSRVQAVAQKYVAWEDERRQKADKQAKSHPTSN